METKDKVVTQEARKANDLINMYYGCNAKTQLEAIEEAERAVLTGLCQIIDDMHIHIVQAEDYDINNVKPNIQMLKFWQGVAAELQIIKNKIPV